MSKVIHAYGAREFMSCGLSCYTEHEDDTNILGRCNVECTRSSTIYVL